jgi:hypothetical protein
MSQRILACVTFHYIAGRLVWLRQVVECFSRYSAPVHLVIVTNTIDPAELASIEALAPSSGMVQMEHRSFGALLHPFELTWSHKAIIVDEFLTGDETHFIYVEDDIVIASEAFAYWVEYRTPLGRRGLIPGFLRVEQESANGTLFATDQMRHTQLDRIRVVRVGQWAFTNMDSAYTGSFILDRELAAEYAATRSFDKTASLAVKSNWSIRERAAMGLCFEHVPRFFWSRLVVPFNRETLRVPEFAHVLHAAGNYANDPNSRFAKIPVDKLLLKPDIMLFIRERARTVWRLVQSYVRRVIAGG